MHEELTVKVRFAETDALGHVNNTSYFIYQEEARVEFFGKLGYELNASEWHFILASTKCDFLSQGYFGQTLAVETTVHRIGTKSFGLTHEIKDKESRTLIARGLETIVYFNFHTQQSETVPDSLRAKLEQYLVTA
ncbi:acyl-CoA thioesterase [Bacillus marinisedimentorum]|uniref:acyl-CoA thioesterase n=1 Tax=Bacillus marinisedimentorum TaxID=1821260 RepID=UPI0007E0AB68|nr:thioesterase family protein [Bacillus marinisedimentorum]